MKSSFTISIAELAEKLGGTVHLPQGAMDTAIIQGIAAVDKAKPNDATFLIQPEYMKFASTTAAAVVIAGKVLSDCPRPQIIHSNPYWAFAKTSQMFAPVREEDGKVSPQAYVDSSVKMGKNVTIYAFAFVSAGCEIGDNSVLFPGVYLGRGVKVGSETVLRANVAVEDGCIIGNRVLIHANTTIGADGFGFAPGKDDIAKIPQVGIVRIEDDVEIGGGSTLDRAAMGETVMGRGSKMDSSAHIAHNVRVGQHTMICGGVFVAGSAKIGNRVILAGCSTINNHVEIVDGVTIGGLAGVTKSIEEAGEYMGFPAIPAGEWRRQMVAIRRLKNMEDRLRKLERSLGESAE